jgi:hypothetical protein
MAGLCASVPRSVGGRHVFIRGCLLRSLKAISYFQAITRAHDVPQLPDQHPELPWLGLGSAV